MYVGGNNLKNIMVATDGSEHSNRAIEKAMHMTSTQEETFIDLVYVVDEETSRADILHYGDADTANFKRKKMLEQQAEKIRQGRCTVTINILHGNPSEMLISYANERSYDLVLVGSRGRNKLQTMLLGSVSHKLVKYIEAPVMVIK